jgi:sulfur transfer complex TusBCD TusB component (DsrH family)
MFETKKNVPLLFNIVLEIAIRRSKVETRVHIFDKFRQILAYLDDVLLWEEGVFTSLVENTNKMELQINEKSEKNSDIITKALQ